MDEKAFRDLCWGASRNPFRPPRSQRFGFITYRRCWRLWFSLRSCLAASRPCCSYYSSWTGRARQRLDFSSCAQERCCSTPAAGEAFRTRGRGSEAPGRWILGDKLMMVGGQRRSFRLVVWVGRTIGWMLLLIAIFGMAEVGRLPAKLGRLRLRPSV